MLLDEEMKKAAENSRKRTREEETLSQEELGMEGRNLEDDDDEDDFKDGEQFVVTEADYDQLLREIEEEMRRDEELLLEEYESSLKSEGQYLEELLQGAGQGDSNLSNDEGDDDNVVLCPICESCDLVQTEAEVILCRRRDCGFRIDIMNDGLRLRDLKRNLGEIFLEHGMDCDKKLRFSVVSEFEISMVVGRCTGCVREFVVL